MSTKGHVLVLGCLIAGCNGIIGLRDIEEATSDSGSPDAASIDRDGASLDGAKGDAASGDGGVPDAHDASELTDAGGAGPDANDAGGDAGDAGPDASDASDGADAGPPTIAGVLHFLQPSGSVTLSTGADSVVLTTNGTFQLPVHAPSYDVTVTSQPAGQTCWVVNGAGNTASPTAGLEVRCTVLARSVGTQSSESKLVASGLYAPLGDVADVTFQSDVPARTLLYLSVPCLNATPGSPGSEYRVGLFVDGALFAESVSRVEYSDHFNHTPILVVVAPTLGATAHTISAQWRRVDGADTVGRPAAASSGAPMHAELGAIVLDSLSTFDRVESSSSASPANLSALGADQSIGIPQLPFTTTAGQPGLFVASVPDLTGDAFIKLQIDGATTAFHRFYGNVSLAPKTSATPMILKTLTAGPHTLDARVNGIVNNNNPGFVPSYGTSSGSNAPKTAALMALLWRSTANAAAAVNDDLTTAKAGGFLKAGNSVSLVTTKPAKALVMMDVTQAASSVPSNGDEAPTEVSLFVANQPGPTIQIGHGGWGDEGRSNVASRISIVDIPAGTTALDLRFGNYAALASHVVASRFGAVILE